MGTRKRNEGDVMSIDVPFVILFVVFASFVFGCWRETNELKDEIARLKNTNNFLREMSIKLDNKCKALESELGRSDGDLRVVVDYFRDSETDS